jgi:ligand-binding sensor domain-containing protein
MLQDKIGDLWIGTCGAGAYRYDGKTFTNFSFDNDMLQSDGLHHNVIQSMIEDKAGNIWFTSLTHGGVSRYDGINFTHFSSDDGLKDDMVYSSFQDKAGNLWFGSIQTKYEGLYRYDGKSFTSFGKEDGLCDNFVTGFFEDRAGKLWIRTGSVLCLYDGENLHHLAQRMVKA